MEAEIAGICAGNRWNEVYMVSLDRILYKEWAWTLTLQKLIRGFLFIASVITNTFDLLLGN